jgi:hypothetical protein
MDLTFVWVCGRLVSTQREGVIMYGWACVGCGEWLTTGAEDNEHFYGCLNGEEQ